MAWTSLVLALLLATPGPASADAAPAARRQAADGDALLREALEVRYGPDLRARVRLVLRDRRGRERIREIETLTSHGDGRMRSLGRVLEPASLRGMTILTLEERERADDVFVFLPELGRARRVATAQRGDAFLGSDVSYDDFERHRAEDFQVREVLPETWQGEPALRVVTRPRRGGYARVDFVVAAADAALLEMAYHRSEGRIARLVTSPREGLVSHGSARIPTRLRAETPGRGTATDVEVLDLEIAPEIDDRIFSLVTLEARRRFGAAAGEGATGRDRSEAD